MPKRIESSWKYEVGDLLCNPRTNTDNVWGALIVIRLVKNTAKWGWYECYSQKTNRIISMPKDTLEKGWYVATQKEKKET